MADTKISALPVADDITGAVVPIVQGGANKQAAAALFEGLDGSDGLDGADGADGRTILNGAVDPTTEGEDGDFYLNTATQTMFGPKAAGVWPAGVLLKGADGADGLDGEDGADATLTPIPEYTETGATLAFAADPADIEIPCDGKVYQLTITGDCNLVTGAVPVAPECGSTIVYVLIDTATPPVITIDATWNWPDSTAVDLPTADGARAELVLNTTPQGWVVARVTEIGVPA